MVADLACGHEEADRAPIGISDGVQLGIHAALRAADQAAPLVAAKATAMALGERTGEGALSVLRSARTSCS